MKKSILIAALVTLPLSLSHAWAEDTQRYDKDKKPATATDGGSAGNAGSSSRPGAMTDKNKKPTATMMDKDQQMPMGMTQENMLLMHEQMHKITAAKTPQEREQHMQAHA